MMTINCRVPVYTAFLDDGCRLEFETQDYVVQVHDTAIYTMFNLLAEIRYKLSGVHVRSLPFGIGMLRRRDCKLLKQMLI